MWFREWKKSTKRKGGRKRTVDYGCRNASRIKINKLDLEIPSVTYVKSNKATSAAGKDSGRSKTNQDSYINEKNINGISGFGIFGVLDGHGINGHFSSQFVKKYILNKIKNLPVVRNLAKPKDIYQYLVGNNYRVIANIPVILMGETGCGKTFLIKKLNQLLNNGEENVEIININPAINDDILIDKRALLEIKKDENTKYLKLNIHYYNELQRSYDIHETYYIKRIGTWKSI